MPRLSPYRTPTAAIAFAVVLGVLVVALVLIPLLAGAGGFGFPFGVFGSFCGVFLIVIVLVIVLIATGAAAPRTIPPPPPIQQPMVPAGMQGSVALDCPNCGAPPTNVDRFGVATCTYCGTRFLVR